MDDDARILREFQRLSVGAFDDSFKHSLEEEHDTKPKNTFHALQINHVYSANPNSYAKQKYFNYIHSGQEVATEHQYIAPNDTESNDYSDGFSIDYIINDLKRRKENRLRKQHRNGVSYRNEHKYSRFRLAATHKQRRNHKHTDRYSEDDMEKYKEIINKQSSEMESLRAQLQQKEEMIASLEYKLSQRRESRLAKPNGHRRQKSMTQTHTEQSTIESVRWSLRSEITKMTAAENDVHRLLQSVGDTSMIHDRLKKIHDTISVHKRKVSALEQSLQMDAFQALTILPADQSVDVYPYNDSIESHFHAPLSETQSQNAFIGDEKKDFELLSNEYCKLKLEFAELKQEQQQWNNTKQELQSVNKRCDNLMNMLDKLSDEKLQLTLQIEDLNAFLNKNNLVYNR